MVDGKQLFGFFLAEVVWIRVPSSFMFVQFLVDFNKVLLPLHIIKKNSYTLREGSIVRTHMPIAKYIKLEEGWLGRA